MSYSFNGLSLLSQALRNYQRGMDVTGHNIANVNTPGFSRQRIQYAQNAAITEYTVGGAYKVGSGVSIAGIYRMRDSLLDDQWRNASSDLARNNALLDSVGQIEAVFPEPGDTGISNALQKFFDSWSALSANPSDTAAKIQVQQAALTLTSRVRATYSELTSKAQSMTDGIKGNLARVDELTSNIAALNKQIGEATAGGAEPSDLLDQRDQMIDELSGYMKLSVTTQPNGMVDIYSGELRLVNRGDSFAIPKTFDAASGTLSDGTRTYAMLTGSILGQMQSSGMVQGVMGQLDSLANTLRTEVNALHEKGVNAAGDTGIDFFADSSPQTGASNFDLSSDVKTDLTKIMGGTSGAAGDGTLALSLSKLRESKITTLGTKTFQGYFSDVVGSVGGARSQYEGLADTNSAMLSQIDSRRAQSSGVNLDEEMTNLMRFQRSYQAAAKALSVLDQTADDLVNLIR